MSSDFRGAPLEDIFGLEAYSIKQGGEVSELIYHNMIVCDSDTIESFKSLGYSPKLASTTFTLQYCMESTDNVALQGYKETDDESEMLFFRWYLKEESTFEYYEYLKYHETITGLEFKAFHQK